MSHAERPVDVGPVRLVVAEAGAGQRPLLLLHGFTGAKEDFTPWLGRLAEAGWHAVAPDLRGHGDSAKPPQEAEYSFEIFADDALRLADALGWERFTLLGHSMGGMIAQFVALRDPGRLGGLVLMDTGHGPVAGLDPDLVDAAVSIVRSQGINALADLLADIEGPLDTPAHRRLLSGQPGYAEFCDRKLRAASAAMYAAMAPEFARTPDRLAALAAALPATLPVAVLVGEQDESFLRPSRELAARAGSGSLFLIDDAGHCPQFENPQGWWDSLAGFLAGL